MKQHSFLTPFFILFGLSILLINSSCSALLTSSMGIHQPKPLTAKKFKEWKAELLISDSLSFMLNEALFTSRFYELKSRSDYNTIRGDVNDYYQPLKAIYINNENDSVIACVFNCLADIDGLNLTWNKNGEMNVFPPKYQEYVSRVIPVSYHFDIITEQERLNKQLILTPKKYTVLVFWSAFEGRQTKRFVNQVRSNVLNHVADSCQIIYVNTDEFYAKHISD